MGLDRSKQIGGLKNGEFNATSGSSAYYGGSPVEMSTVGIQLAISGSTAFIGIAANDSITDDIAANSPMTFYSLPFLCTLILDANNANDAYPYDTTLTWAQGDKVYINNVGLWTNVDPGSSDPQRGIVMAVTATSLTVLFHASARE